MENPFEVLEKRIANIEKILLDDVGELKQLMIRSITGQINSENIKDYYDTKLKDIFSTRVSKVMRDQAYITTLGELIDFVNGVDGWRIEELGMFRNFGKNCVKEVASYFEANGIDYKR